MLGNISETVPFRDGVATVDANPDRLRLDIVMAAQRSGIDRDNAEEIANNTLLTLSPETNYNHVLKEFEHLGTNNLLYMMGSYYLRVVAGQVSRQSPMGSTFDLSDNLAILINPSGISKELQMLGNIPEKIARDKFIDRTYAVWRHEREHLIRSMSPKTKIKDIQHRLLFRNAGAFGLAMFGGLGLYNSLDLQYLASVHSDFWAGPVSITGPMLISLGIYNVSKYLWYLALPAEKAAKEAEENGTNIDNLFNFKFE